MLVSTWSTLPGIEFSLIDCLPCWSFEHRPLGATQ